MSKRARESCADCYGSGEQFVCDTLYLPCHCSSSPLASSSEVFAEARRICDAIKDLEHSASLAAAEAAREAAGAIQAAERAAQAHQEILGLLEKARVLLDEAETALDN